MRDILDKRTTRTTRGPRLRGDDEPQTTRGPRFRGDDQPAPKLGPRFRGDDQPAPKLGPRFRGDDQPARRSSVARLIAVLALSGGLVACGFHLRGQADYAF